MEIRKTDNGAIIWVDEFHSRGDLFVFELDESRDHVRVWTSDRVPVGKIEGDSARAVKGLLRWALKLGDVVDEALEKARTKKVGQLDDMTFPGAVGNAMSEGLLKASHLSKVGPDLDSPVTSFPELPTRCADCGGRQYDTPSGASCISGHGGVDGIPDDGSTPGIPERVVDKPMALVMMPGIGVELQGDRFGGYDAMWIAMHHNPMQTESHDAYFNRVIEIILPKDADRRYQEFVRGARLAFETNCRNGMVADRTPFWTIAGPLLPLLHSEVVVKVAEILDRVASGR